MIHLKHSLHRPIHTFLYKFASSVVSTCLYYC